MHKVMTGNVLSASEKFLAEGAPVVLPVTEDSILVGNASVLNVTGAGVTATDDGGGVITLHIPGTDVGGLNNAYQSAAVTADNIILMSGAKGPILLRDSASPLGGTLFGVQDSSGAAGYLAVTANGSSMATSLTVPLVAGSGATLVLTNNTVDNVTLTLQNSGVDGPGAYIGDTFGLSVDNYFAFRRSTSPSEFGIYADAVAGQAGGEFDLWAADGDAGLSGGFILIKSGAPGSGGSGGDYIQMFNSAMKGITVDSSGVTLGTASFPTMVNDALTVTALSTFLGGVTNAGSSTSTAYWNSVDGSTAALSAAGNGRLRYNNMTFAWEVSINGGAYTALALATGLNGLESAYASSTLAANNIIALAAAHGPVLIRDNGTPLGTTLFAVQNSAGSTGYLTVDATAVTAPIFQGSTAASGTLTLQATSNATDGVINFNSAGSTTIARVTSNVGNSSANPGLILFDPHATGQVAITSDTNLAFLWTGGSGIGAGAGPTMSIRAGTGGPTNGTGGLLFAHGGKGGGSNGAGGGFTGIGGQGVGTGVGGAAVWQGGTGGTTAAGGDASVIGGVGNGGALNGNVNLGTTFTNAVNVAASGITTAVAGTIAVAEALSLTGTAANNYLDSADGSTAAVSGAAYGRLRYNNSVGAWQVSINTAAYVSLHTTASITGLQSVYVSATSAAGNIMLLTSTGGPPLVRDNATPLGTTLFGVQNSTGATKYFDVTAAGATITGTLHVTGKLTVDGAIDPPSLSLSGGTALFIDSADGSTAPLSASAHGRLRYNNGTTAWEMSVNGGAYAAVSTAVGANPTATVGTTAVNGSAATFMRSDAAPAIDTTMAPTMTGIWTFQHNNIAVTSSDEVVVANSTAATVSVQSQWSPRLRFNGQAWIIPGSVSGFSDMYIENQVLGGFSRPIGLLAISAQYTGGSAANLFTFSDNAVFNIGGGGKITLNGNNALTASGVGISSAGNFNVNAGANLVLNPSSGNVNIAANIGLALLSGTGAVDFSPGSGTFKTTTGACTYGGSSHRFSNTMGFFGAAAVAQPTATGASGYAAVGGSAVSSNDTFTGGSGATAYTIGDLVKSLKSLGLIVT